MNGNPFGSKAIGEVGREEGGVFTENKQGVVDEDLRIELERALAVGIGRSLSPEGLLYFNCRVGAAAIHRSIGI
jgi:hypothetical protein